MLKFTTLFVLHRKEANSSQAFEELTSNVLQEGSVSGGRLVGYDSKLPSLVRICCFVANFDFFSLIEVLSKKLLVCHK